MDFVEYWKYAKKLTENQRGSFFYSLSKKNQREIKLSYKKDGWQDVFIQNEVDKLCDKIKDDFGVDLFHLRIKIMKGSLFAINRKVWDYILDEFERYENCYNLNIIFGGIISHLTNPEDDYYILASF